MSVLDIFIVAIVVIGLILLFAYLNSGSTEKTALQCPKCGYIGDNRRSTLVWNEGTRHQLSERYRVCNKCGYCHNFDRRGTQRFTRVSVPSKE